MNKTVQIKEIGGWQVEETVNFYKNLIKIYTDYIEDFTDVMEGEGAANYYSKTKKKVINIKELKEVLNDMRSQSYGAK